MTAADTVDDLQGAERKPGPGGVEPLASPAKPNRAPAAAPAGDRAACGQATRGGGSRRSVAGAKMPQRAAASSAARASTQCAPSG